MTDKTHLMAEWNAIELPPDAIAAGELEQIRAEVSRFFLLHDPGPSLAVFTRRTKSGGCDVFFSPGCEVYAEFIFENHPPKRTRAPALLGTTLLVGYPESVSCLLGKAPAVGSFREMVRQSMPEERAATQASFLRLKSTA